MVSFIGDKSVHNHKIGCLLHNLFRSCLVIFYRLLYAMEYDNLLI